MDQLPKYDVIEKNIHGTKMVPVQNFSRLKPEEEWAKIAGPNAASYNLVEPLNKTKNTELPKYSFGRQEKFEKEKEAEYFDRELHPNIDAVRKVPTKVAINP